MSEPTTNRNLEFGLRDEVPKHAQAAWGARWIYPNDQVWDRQGFFGKGAPGCERLINWLDGIGEFAGKGGAIRKAQDNAPNVLPSRSESRTVILYEDAVGIIKGNPNASHGYVYVCGYLRDPEVDGPYEPLLVTVSSRDIWRFQLPEHLKEQYPERNTTGIISRTFTVEDRDANVTYQITEPTFMYKSESKTRFIRVSNNDQPDRKMSPKQRAWVLGVLKQRGHEPKIIE